MRWIVILFCSYASITFSQNVCGNTVNTGEGTHYDFEAAGGFGNCSFDDTQISPFLIGAMNNVDYGTADYCGACIHIDGPNGSVKVQIIDRCPECKSGDVDLSPEAFIQLAPLIDGRIPISWYVVPCQLTGNITFHYKEGSNQWWTAIQVRNTVNHVSKLEWFTGGQYVELTREIYNYFIFENAGYVNQKFRITDIYGNQVEEEIPFTANLIGKEVQGINQFPSCVLADIDPKQEEPLVTIFENNITFSQALTGEYFVISAEGTIVLQGEIVNELTVSSLSSGLYFLKVVGDKGELLTEKIIL